MSSYNLHGTAIGKESVYDYTRRRWNELRDNFKAGRAPGVTNDAAGAYAASRFIYVELTKNPGLVTDKLPPGAHYLEAYINNPSNPFSWLAQKTGQAAQNAIHDVAVNLDRPAKVMLDYNPFAKGGGDAYKESLPWFLQPRTVLLFGVGIYVAPILVGKSFEGIVKGFMSGRKSNAKGNKGKSLRDRFKGFKGFK